MKRVIGVLLVLIAMLAVGACGGSESSDAPPWGLDSIEMPNTREEIADVFAGFPVVIEGRPGQGDWWGVTYGESDIRWVIQTQPLEDVQMPIVETAADWMAWLASGKSVGVSLEQYSVDPSEALMWVAGNGPGPDGTGTEHILYWAKRGASWVFFASADTEAGRIALVDAFVTAADDSTSWVVNALVVVIVVGIGWWVARYARSVSKGNYRHPKDLKQTWWVAGAGGHGGGGQVPPLIPDPDPEDEIR